MLQISYFTFSFDSNPAEEHAHSFRQKSKREINLKKKFEMEGLLFLFHSLKANQRINKRLWKWTKDNAHSKYNPDFTER